MTQAMASRNPRAGLIHLNLDALALIIEGIDRDSAVMSLQLVNKFFRNLVVKTPSLWTVIDAQYNPVHYLARSKNCPLEISIAVDSGKLQREGVRIWQLRTFVALVTKHASRWETLYLSLSPGHEQPGEDMALLDTLRSPSFPTYLPNLRHLVIESDPNSDSSDMDYYAATTEFLDMDFLEHWTTPKLWKLSFENLVPASMKAPCTTLSLRWNDDRGDDDLGHFTYTSLLQTFSHLTTLELQIERLQDLVYPSLAVPVVLLQLKDLSLIVTGVKARFVEDLLDNLEAPNLRKLECIQTEQQEYFYDLFLQEALFPEEKVRWPLLEIIQVRFSKYYYAPEDKGPTLGKSHPLHYMLTRLPPNIRTLSIAYAYIFSSRAVIAKITEGSYDIPSTKLALHPLLSYIGGNDSLSPPPLHELILTNCQLGTEFLSDNLRILTSPTFKMLHLEKSYDRMDTDAIRGMLPPDKVMMRDGEIVSLQSGVS